MVMCYDTYGRNNDGKVDKLKLMYSSITCQLSDGENHTLIISKSLIPRGPFSLHEIPTKWCLNK